MLQVMSKMTARTAVPGWISRSRWEETGCGLTSAKAITSTLKRRRPAQGPSVKRKVSRLIEP